MNAVLPVAQCWLPGEARPDFGWALETLRQLLLSYEVRLPRVVLTDRDLACMNALEAVLPSVPSMVCRWHMNRNVLARTRQVLGQLRVENPGPFEAKYQNTWETDSFMSKFHAAADAVSEAEFDAARLDLHATNAALADYLEKTWWKYKTKIVACWTNAYAHFGCRDTSVVEGTHSKIKKWIQSSQGDLLTVFLKLLPWWLLTIKKMSLKLALDCTITQHRLQDDRYSAVVRVVTVWALNETEELWKKARLIVMKGLPRSRCSGTFTRIHGRPCLHHLIALTESNGAMKLTPSDFDPHWFTNAATQTHARVLEPVALVPRRRHTSGSTHDVASGRFGTRRDPTFAEMVDRNHSASQPQPLQPTQRLPALGAVLRGIAGISFMDESPARQWGHAGLYP